jgi:uncharacterized protein
MASAGAQGEVAIGKTSFPVANAFERGASVVGELRIPDSKRERLPAVLIVNSTPGFDGRGALYAEALNRAAIATLEIDMFQGRGMPATYRHNMPHVYESLHYLARHPRIDPARVGIMGFSYGGAVALLSSSEELQREYGRGRLRFAAHLGLYPICWRQRKVLDGMLPPMKPGAYRRVTGAPVHILVGSKDDYDGTNGCQAFLAALSPNVRLHFALTVYEGATFAWDSRFGSAVYEASARQGKGGTVTVIADPAIASQSRQFAASYFRKNLGAER